MSSVEFTLDRCRSILVRLRSSGYAFRGYDEEVGTGDALLRHDVDLSPWRAVEVARLERELGITATYFVLLGSPLYNPFDGPVREAIREVAALGHDVGLHFSTHQHWPAAEPPTERELAARIRDEQAALSTIVEDPVTTVSFHVPPEWVLARTFEGVESTYEPRFFDEIDYLADSGQRWREEGVSIPEDGRPLQVLMHPGLWGAEDATFDERVAEAVADADRRTREYARSRYLESERIKGVPTGPQEV